MSKYVRTIYLYIVSFITLCMLIVGIVGAVTSLVAYKYPTVRYYSEYAYGTQKYETGYQEEFEMARRSSIKELFTFIATAVVAAPLFIYHWKSTLKDNDKEV